MEADGSDSRAVDISAWNRMLLHLGNDQVTLHAVVHAQVRRLIETEIAALCLAAHDHGYLEAEVTLSINDEGEEGESGQMFIYDTATGQRKMVAAA